MELFGIMIPTPLIGVLIIISVLILWKIIKFAIKLLLAIIIILGIAIGLDLIGVFSWLSSLINKLI